MKIRKMTWLSTVNAYKIGYEKAIKELRHMKIDEIFMLSVSNSGSLYPSKVRPQPKELKNKDFLTPFIKLAHKEGMKIHAWIVTMNFSNEEFIREHKSLYTVNKLGVSCIDDPPYVKHYMWLCPSNEEVVNNVIDLFLEVASKFDVDGLHFDYIRYSDLILPKGLRNKYEGVPQEEVILPRFDYCYCQHCRSLFKKEYKVDPMNLKYLEPLYGAWFKWRSQKIANLVKQVYSKIKKYDNKLEVSAAVFATPELAYRYVLQDWPSWKIDFYNPMIYHKYYMKPSSWIGEAVKEGVLRGVKVNAGIFIGFMESKEELVNSFLNAINNGATGICTFVYPPPRPELKEWVRKAFNELEKELT